MKIGIIGSGSVAQKLAGGFVSSGHQVMMGTRDPDKLSEWHQGLEEELQQKIRVGTNSEAATYGGILVLATAWSGTMNAIELAGIENIADKVVIDVTNPLDFSQGAPPRMAVVYPSSGGEEIQKMIPDAKVVKAFNTVSADIMVHPEREEGMPDLFIAGDNDYAKKVVTNIAQDWGWKGIHDMGDITNSYWLETFAMLWIYFGFRNNQWTHAFKLLMK